MDDTYGSIGFIVGVIVFLITWAICSITGVGFFFGWLPAAILGFVLGAVWPLTIIFAVILAVMIFG